MIFKYKFWILFVVCGIPFSQSYLSVPRTLVFTTLGIHYTFLHIYVSASWRIERTRKKSFKDEMTCFFCIFSAGQSEGKSEGCARASGQIWWALWETAHKWPGHHLHFGCSALPYPQGPEIPHDAIKQEDSQPSDLPATQPVPVGWMSLGSDCRGPTLEGACF